MCFGHMGEDRGTRMSTRHLVVSWTRWQGCCRTDLAKPNMWRAHSGGYSHGLK